jgi:hypothetical protein
MWKLTDHSVLYHQYRLCKYVYLFVDELQGELVQLEQQSVLNQRIQPAVAQEIRQLELTKGPTQKIQQLS